ncbi:MAG TPA: hypothetical protein VE422_37530 [Terriglobia bacterium]|nr:hypothetical protein [Terriglobia bacterium]
MAALLAVLLTLGFAAQAGAGNRMLGLYAGRADGLDAASVETVRSELQSLLRPAGFDLIWRDSAQRKSGEDFDFVVVSSFDGSCSTDDLSTSSSALALNSVILADTSVSGSRVLPFFRVDCAQLIRMLAPSLKPLSPAVRQIVVQRALARLMAHEIYHIVAQTTGHQSSGIAKASFSIRDLTADRFEFDIWSLSQMKPQPAVVFSESAER